MTSTFRGSDLNDAEIAYLFGEYLTSITDMYTIIAADASKSSEVTSIVGCSSYSYFGYRVNSIFTAEALAIRTAIDELLSLHGACAIFSDSLSVLSALRAVNIHSPTVILWLHSKFHRLSLFNTRILLCWVPGRKGIPTNEKADSIARRVCSSAFLLE